jgi:hypothetical protein
MNLDLNNNNNYIEVNNSMAYLSPIEKSFQKPSSTRFEKKNIFSIQKNNNLEKNINNTSYSKEILSNEYRNSERMNNYRWKLLPKHKYNSQVYNKSLMDIPSQREEKS